MISELLGLKDVTPEAEVMLALIVILGGTLVLLGIGLVINLLFIWPREDKVRRQEKLNEKI